MALVIIMKSAMPRELGVNMGLLLTLVDAVLRKNGLGKSTWREHRKQWFVDGGVLIHIKVRD
jgi:hypothetical protein